MSVFHRAALVCVAGFLFSGSVSAEDRIPAEHFHPRDPASGTLATEHPFALDHLGVSSFVLVHWVEKPLVVNTEDGFRGEESLEIALVDQALTLDAGLSFGLFDILTFSVGIPLVISQTSDAVPEIGIGEDISEDVETAGFSEARAGVKATILATDSFGVALETRVFLPAFVEFRQSALRVQPMLLAGYRGDSVKVSANLGWDFREQLETVTYEGGQQFLWALGAEWEALPGLSVIGNGFGGLDIERERGSALSTELQAGLSYMLVDGLKIQAAGGVGVTSGVGSPALRVLGGLAYAPPAQDADNDGVIRSLDRCPEGPEDFDGFEDEDGCPDPDNDQDGLLDEDDLCPDLAEDKDGFEDEDGCPDLDNDQDGVLDEDDECPMVAGILELKGCPAKDTDQDGIEDHLDACVDQPEDFDGFEDEDGCPDLDNDQDGISDVEDECPLVPGVPEFKGCPDDGPSKIRLKGSRLEIGERVYFDTASDRIQPRSFPILRQMAAVLRTQPGLKKIRVSGHTDSRGDDAMNLDLSERRAQSVMRFLIEEGIDAGRLSARGFGESHPVDTNDTSKGRELNRRVEFHILEREEPEAP